MNTDDINQPEEFLPHFVTVAYVAQRLSISKMTVYRYMKRKKNPLPYIHLSDQTIRIPFDQLEVWIKDQEGGDD